MVTIQIPTVLGQVTDVFGLLDLVSLLGKILSSFFGHFDMPHKTPFAYAIGCSISPYDID